jgi:two-component system invasion response regulator UvrY
MQTIRTVLVDDHAIVRMGFRLLLAGTSDIRVVGEAASGEEALPLVRETLPDVVVVDISMPGMGGLALIERLVARDPKLRLLVLTAHQDPIHVRRALTAGARGYLSKRTAPEALADAIRQLARGQLYLDRELASEVALHDISAAKDPVSSLSTREFEVFMQLAHGCAVAQIAKVLCVSASTIGTHLYNIKQKLGAANSAELAMIAMRAGLVEV